MVYFIDTNIFLRIIVKEDERVFNDCLSFLRKVEDGDIKIKTSSLVIAELVWTLNSYYKIAKPEVVESIKLVLGIRGLEIIDNYDIQKAQELFAMHNVKFIDALIASCLQPHNMQIVSYDKDYDKLGILRIQPEQI